LFSLLSLEASGICAVGKRQPAYVVQDGGRFDHYFAALKKLIQCPCFEINDHLSNVPALVSYLFGGLAGSWMLFSSFELI